MMRDSLRLWIGLLLRSPHSLSHSVKHPGELTGLAASQRKHLHPVSFRAINALQTATGEKWRQMEPQQPSD
jgi:hypothetical protein